jgi:hypothetical protein
MNLNIKIFLLCPIPDDQKPISEYINLKENDFTNLILLTRKNYLQKIFINFLLGFIIMTPFAYLFKFENDLFLFNSFFSINLLIFVFTINFSRWSQLLKRFRSSRLFYEEGSWYDGQFWEKPMELIKNDKLLSTQKIKPILKRILKTIFCLTTINLFIYINYLMNF